jgi:hypothetical protein
VTSVQSSSDAPRQISATVTLQSNQNPDLGLDGQACTLWNLGYPFSGTPATSLYVYGVKGRAGEACDWQYFTRTR